MKRFMSYITLKLENDRKKKKKKKERKKEKNQTTQARVEEFLAVGRAHNCGKVNVMLLQTKEGTLWY